jgi:hypothetical protein
MLAAVNAEIMHCMRELRLLQSSSAVLTQLTTQHMYDALSRILQSIRPIDEFPNSFKIKHGFRPYVSLLIGPKSVLSTQYPKAHEIKFMGYFQSPDRDDGNGGSQTYKPFEAEVEVCFVGAPDTVSVPTIDDFNRFVGNLALKHP